MNVGNGMAVSAKGCLILIVQSLRRVAVAASDYMGCESVSSWQAKGPHRMC